jgi:hypothetical protein
MLEELGARLLADISGAHRHGLDASLAARLGHVDRIFQEDHRIIVGERDRAAAALHGRLRYRLRRGQVLQAIEGSCFRDVPVLAELAGEIAPRGAEGQHGRAGQEMVEGLLLDRVDAEPRRAAVGCQHHLIIVPGPHET